MELAATLALWWAPVIVLALLFRLIGVSGLRFGWLLTAIGVYAAYTLAILEGGPLIPLEQYVGALDWNWAGKIAAIATVVLPRRVPLCEVL